MLKPADIYKLTSPGFQIRHRGGGVAPAQTPADGFSECPP